MAWIGTTSLLIFGSRLGMIVHIALPWLALVLGFLFPRDFTLLKNLSSVPVGLTFGWLIMSPATFGSPAHIAFVGPEDRFLRFGLGLGGLFAATALTTAPADEKRLSYLLHVAQLLFMSLLYGYVATKEVDVVFDRSPKVIYQSRIIDKEGFRAYGSPHSLPIESWGPVQTNAYATIPHFERKPNVGEPICMVLRKGALGVPWYLAEQCTRPNQNYEPLRQRSAIVMSQRATD